MSKVLSLKLKDNVFEETENILHKIHKARNGYINDALAFYNKVFQRNFLKLKLAKESRIVADDSLAILKDFDSLNEI
ncbi:MAG: hypothetical protein V1843_04290 [bacterium]